MTPTPVRRQFRDASRPCRQHPPVQLRLRCPTRTPRARVRLDCGFGKGGAVVHGQLEGDFLDVLNMLFGLVYAVQVFPRLRPAEPEADRRVEVPFVPHMSRRATNMLSQDEEELELSVQAARAGRLICSIASAACGVLRRLTMIRGRATDARHSVPGRLRPRAAKQEGYPV